MLPADQAADAEAATATANSVTTESAIVPANSATANSARPAGQDHEPEPRTPHVIVVGGGLAGLVAARELLNGGARVTLLEASERLGGKVASHSVGGIRLDAGAESFATRGGTVAALINELGLADDIVPPAAAGAWLLTRSGKALPLPKAGLLGIPAVPLARDVIAIVGLVGALRAQLDGLLLGFVGARERNLGALVRKRMGRAVLERLVTPVAGAIHSAHPDQLDVDVVAPRLRDAVLSRGSLAAAVLTIREAAPAGAAVQGLSGGVFRLVDALADSIRARADIRLGSTVTVVETTGVTLGDGQQVDGDQVVVAADLGPGSGVDITLATLVVRCAELRSAPRGTGVLVAPGAVGVQAKALTHATAKWAWLADAADDRQVLRLSYETAPDSDDALREQARADAAVLLGVDLPAASVVAFARQRWAGPRRAAPTTGANDDSASRPTSNELSTPRAAEDVVHPVLHIGERVSGTGLAAVIRQARTESENLLTDLASRPGLRLAPPS